MKLKKCKVIIERQELICDVEETSKGDLLITLPKLSNELLITLECKDP